MNDPPASAPTDPSPGLITRAGPRSRLHEAVALGCLRKLIVTRLGVVEARVVFTQLGFTEGWQLGNAARDVVARRSVQDREAEALDAEDDWRMGGFYLHSSAGRYLVAPGSAGVLSRGGVSLISSYEAEQHLLHFGVSDVPACWIVAGLCAGYLSRVLDEEVRVVEDRCVAKGDATCHLAGKVRARHAPRPGVRSEPPSAEESALDGVREQLEDADRRLRERTSAMPLAPEVNLQGLVAKSAAMRDVVDLARRIARVDSTVLVTGESGAGKERIAMLVHAESPRAAGPFVAVKCGAIAETLLDSELFGHARGAFPGASQDRAGLFEAAHQGTLLLDEVDAVSVAMQVKLLRALEEREVTRVGETRSRAVDVRVIAATNRNLERGAEGGSFRQDLYYRLKVVQLRVPALRQREDDILPLARLFAIDASRQMKRAVVGFGPGVAELLRRYPWPGNVRELANAMERAVALATGPRVEVDDLPEELRARRAGSDGAERGVQMLEDVEREYILAALAVNLGNQTRTARQLGIGTATLYRKLKLYRETASVEAPRALSDATSTQRPSRSNAPLVVGAALPRSKRH